MDLDNYFGPLVLFCNKCNQDKLTHVKFYQVNTDRDPLDETMFHYSAHGRRHCGACDSTNVVLKFISITVTIDNESGVVT